MVTCAGARYSSLFFEAADAAFFEAAGATLRMSLFEATEADAITTSEQTGVRRMQAVLGAKPAP